MKHEQARGLVALLAGVLFGSGLLLSGMTRPDRVLAFLDLFGAWDPTLAFVMIGAIGVHACTRRSIVQRSAAARAGDTTAPALGIDRKLAVGAALFGVGWGLAGYCPGPSVVSLASGAGGACLFFASMVAGMLLASRFAGSLAARSPTPSQPSSSVAGLPSARREPS